MSFTRCARRNQPKGHRSAAHYLYKRREASGATERASESSHTHRAPAPMLMSPQGSKYKDFALRRCMAITLIGADFARRSLLFSLSLALRYDDAHSAKILSWRSCTRYILVRRISSDLTLKQWQSTTPNVVICVRSCNAQDPDPING